MRTSFLKDTCELWLSVPSRYATICPQTFWKTTKLWGTRPELQQIYSIKNVYCLLQKKHQHFKILKFSFPKNTLHCKCLKKTEGASGPKNLGGKITATSYYLQQTLPSTLNFNSGNSFFPYLSQNLFLSKHSHKVYYIQILFHGGFPCLLKSKTF